jgi:3-oxoacyl-[acyl-carrier-protein] synthase II
MLVLIGNTQSNQRGSTPSMRRRVVITGLGVVAPNGIGTDTFWKALISGKSGIREITRFDASSFPCHIGGEVNGLDPLDFMAFKLFKRTGRFVHLGVAAASLASRDAELSRIKNRESIGIMAGSSVNALDGLENLIMVLSEKGFRRVSPYSPLTCLPHAVTGAISIVLNLKGISLTFSTGCSSGINAIGIGSHMIQKNAQKAIVCVGTDAPITPTGLAGFSASGMLAQNNDPPEKISRPFDAKRTGGVLSEGAGAMVLEDLKHALRRGATIYAEVAGFASTSEAYSMTELEPAGREFARTMRLALRDGGSDLSEIDYICAHAPSDPVSDAVESQAIKKVFGPNLSQKIPISSIKSMIGNPLGAAGIVQAVVAVLTINKGILPPTINYEYPDPRCDLDYVPNTPRKKEVSTALVNSHGLGASDTTLVVKRYSE